ncbi:MAG: response regulator [Nitrospirae bacterium]|nr:response regulator [Nitrospirota bacterium]
MGGAPQLSVHGSPAPSVLVADDDESVLTLLGDVLTQMGLRVVKARGGIEAMAMFRKERPDLVILDIDMSPPDGVEICRRIKSDPVTALTPVVMVTGVGTSKEKLKSFEYGADAYFEKPVNLWELQARLKGLLRTKKLTDHLRERKGGGDLGPRVPVPSPVLLTPSPAGGRGGGVRVSTARGESSAASSGESGLKILIAEDEAATLDLLRSFFQTKGYEVALAEDGKEALARFKPGTFAAVLLDVNMPGLSGLQALEEIRRQDAHVPVVMLTAVRDRTVAHKAIDLGANDYILKPFNLEALEKNLIVKILMNEFA